jgi:hypothetical protein
VIAVVLASWLLAAVVVGASGTLAFLPVPPPAVAIALTAGILLLLWKSAAAWNAVRAIPLRALVAFHTCRAAAGALFLLLGARGELPASFAIPAGWGDLAVGLAALPVAIACIPPRSTGQRRIVLLWNALGAIDTLAVLANGFRLLLQAGGAAAGPFTVLPLALLPTFVVPIVLTTHVLVAIRVAAPPDGR